MYKIIFQRGGGGGGRLDLPLITIRFVLFGESCKKKIANQYFTHAHHFERETYVEFFCKIPQDHSSCLTLD